MPLGSYLPFLLLPLLPVQDGSVSPELPAVQEVEPLDQTEQASEVEVEAEADTPQPVPTEYTCGWLSAVGSSWLPLDDPSAHVLPEPLLRLKGVRDGLFESSNSSSLLLIRNLAELQTQVDGFMADEEVLALQGEFMPLEDRSIDGISGPSTAFDCEWKFGELATRVATLYVTTPEGLILALWIVTLSDRPFLEMQQELEGIATRYLKGEGAPLTRYTARINAHEIAFSLGTGPDLTLLPLPEIDLEHSTTSQSIRRVNPSFLVSFNRQWADAKSGISLSYQVVQHDLGFGPPNPFVHWIAGVYQSAVRGDIDKGDAPRELLHLEQVRTEVISDEAMARHYKNCQRTRDVGVILEVLLPRSPYARVCRLNWARPQDGEPNFFGRMWFVELRHYHPGRGETVTGTSVLILRAQAKTLGELNALEESMDLSTRPIGSEGRFPLTY